MKKRAPKKKGVQGLPPTMMRTIFSSSIWSMMSSEAAMAPPTSLCHRFVLDLALEILLERKIENLKSYPHATSKQSGRTSPGTMASTERSGDRGGVAFSRFDDGPELVRSRSVRGPAVASRTTALRGRIEVRSIRNTSPRGATGAVCACVLARGEKMLNDA